MSMKQLQAYNSPEMTVIEIMGKDGVMIGIESEGNEQQLSRTTDHYDNDDETDGSRSVQSVWDDELSM